MLKKLGIALVIAVGLWLAVLGVGGIVARDYVKQRLETRVGDSFHGEATVRRIELAFVRGHVELDGLSVKRSEALGSLTVEVDALRCEQWPLGLGLVEHGCRELDLEGIRLDVSSLAFVQWKKPKRRPVQADQVAIRNATITFAAGALVPGLDAIEIVIEHAEAGPTTFKSPLSWLFAVESLDMTVKLPAGIVLHLDYANGQLAARGTLLGSRPITLPIVLPVASAATDAHDELRALVTFGRDIATRLIERRVESLFGRVL